MTSSHEFDTTDALVEEYLAYRGFTDVRIRFLARQCGVSFCGWRDVAEGCCACQALSSLRREAAADRVGKYNADAFIDRIRALLGR
jgi:hypothetical protein